MTYREEIQKMINDLQSVYDRANWLRDKSDLDGQNAFNEVRRILPHAWAPLQKLDDSISGNWANRQV